VREERVKEIMDRLLNLLQQGEIHQYIARTVIKRDAKDQGKPSDNWSMLNRIIVLLYGTEDARGYRQWEAVGRHVKKGSKAIYILAPRMITKTISETIIDETGEEKKVQKRIQVLAGFVEIPVFRLEDTEGQDLPQVNYAPPVMPPLYGLAQEYGIEVKYFPFEAQYYGYYAPSRDEIVLCTHDQAVFFHELAHAIYHRTVRPLAPGQDPRQEIVAETCAAALCVLYGLEGYIPNCREYIEAYAKKNVIAAIAGVISDCEKVLTAIMDYAQKEQKVA